MSIVPVAGGRTFESLLRYLGQQITASGGTVTDLNRLSVLRTLAEIMALLGERWEEELAVVAAEGIDRATYRSFGFPQQPATKAYGQVVFSRIDTALAQTIPAGTVVRVPSSSRRFVTYLAATLGVGESSVTVGVLAEGVGAIWNTNAATITEIVTTVGGAALTVTNVADISTGGDEQTDEDRREAFARYIASIHRATADAIEYGARTAELLDAFGVPTEAIASAQTVDTAIPGVATCYAWDGVTTNPALPAISALLQAQGQRVIDGYVDVSGLRVPGYKAAGAVVNLVPATIRAVPVTVAVYPAPGWTLAMVEEGVRAAIARVFARLAVGDPLLRASDIRNAVGAIRGVIDHDTVTPRTVSPPTVPLGVIAAPLALATNNASTFAAGTYRVAYSIITAAGESRPSETTAVAVSGTSQSIALGPFPFLARDYPTAVSIQPWISAIGANAGDTLYKYGSPVAVGSFAGFGSIAQLMSTPPNVASDVRATLAGAYASEVPHTTGIANPGPLTTLASIVAGASTLGVGAYYYGYTLANANGETLLSGPGGISVSGGSERIQFPALTGLSANATEIRWYTTFGGSAYGSTMHRVGTAAVSGGSCAAVTMTAPWVGTEPIPPTVNTSALGSLETGRLVAGDYYVAYAWKTSGGTTQSAPIQAYIPLRLHGSGDIQVAALTASLPADPNVTPASNCTVAYYVSTAPGATTLAYVGAGSGGVFTITDLPATSAVAAPTANGSANVGGGTGVIIVPSTVTIIQGS